MTGFAGAAISAELGTMVVGEEIEALEAHALNPVRFLVVPRLIAVVISLTLLAVIANVVAIAAGMLMGVAVLGIPPTTYWNNMLLQVDHVDFLTGLAKSAVFGLLVGVIACSNGFRVTGGAAGVGVATTNTVVQSIVSIIIADLIFTALFFSLELFGAARARRGGHRRYPIGCSTRENHSRSSVMPAIPVAATIARIHPSAGWPDPNSQAAP